MLVDIAKNAPYYDIQCDAINRLNENEYYEQILEMIDLNKKDKPNLSAIGALKIIPKDKILNSNYMVFKIIVRIDKKSEKYKTEYGRITTKYWRTRDYNIEIKSKNIKKVFSYHGKRGGVIKAFQRDLDRIHRGAININEICEFLLSPISKEDILKISTDSDVIYLREAAKNMLQNGINQ